MFFERLTIYVWADGGVGVSVQSKAKQFPVELELIGVTDEVKKYLSVIELVCEINSSTKLSLSYFLLDIDLDTAENFAKATVKNLLLLVRGKSYFLNAKGIIYHTMLPGYSRRIPVARFEFNLTGVDYERIIDLYLASRFEDGFAHIFDKRLLLSNDSLIILSYDYRNGEIWNYASLVFPSFFNFKLGMLYTLDLKSLLGEEFDLRASRSSHYSIIEVELYYPGNGKVVIEDVYFPVEYFISEGRRRGVPFVCVITNNNPLLVNILGKIIDNIVVKFRLVEFGFKFDVSSPSLVGYLIIIPVLVFSFAVIYYFRVKRKC